MESGLVRCTQKKGLTSLDLAVTALLISAGAVIRMVVPPLGGITPNFAIAMYSLAIILARPKYTQALGIGLVAGAVCMFTSKAAYPVNLVSESIGALVCLVVCQFTENRCKGFILNPLIITALATLASGLSFIGTYFIFKLAPVAVIVSQMLMTVIILTVLNSLIVQVLYFPAKKMLKNMRSGE